MSNPPDFVDWDPSFFPIGPGEPGNDGLVWLYDCEGERLLRCDPALAEVVAAALEYAYYDVQRIYGVGWGNLSNEQVIWILRKHRGEHPHVGAESVEPLQKREKTNDQP